MESVIGALTQLIENDTALDAERECLVDTAGAPECVSRLVRALSTHAWRVFLGDYALHDNGSERVVDLGTVFELLEDLECELEDALTAVSATTFLVMDRAERLPAR